MLGKQAWHKFTSSYKNVEVRFKLRLDLLGFNSDCCCPVVAAYPWLTTSSLSSRVAKTCKINKVSFTQPSVDCTYNVLEPSWFFFSNCSVV